MTKANPTDFERRALDIPCSKCAARKGYWCRTDAIFGAGAFTRKLHTDRLDAAHDAAWSTLEGSMARHPAGSALGGDAA